jgi:hypothetical protein
MDAAAAPDDRRIRSQEKKWADENQLPGNGARLPRYPYPVCIPDPKIEAAIVVTRSVLNLASIPIRLARHLHHIRILIHLWRRSETGPTHTTNLDAQILRGKCNRIRLARLVRLHTNQRTRSFTPHKFAQASARTRMRLARPLSLLGKSPDM